MSRFRHLSRTFYRRPADVVAADLLGRYLVRDVDGERVVARLVEVEAYLGADDPASHAFRGRTARNAAMFLAGGHAYVYFVYGMHFCMNVVTGDEGVAHAVLLRAAEVVEGAEIAVRRRGVAADAVPRLLAGGPARLCQALAIDRSLDGASLTRGALTLREGEPVAPRSIARDARVGVDYAGEAAGWPLRFLVRDSAAVSRPPRRLSASLRAARGRSR